MRREFAGDTKRLRDVSQNSHPRMHCNDSVMTFLAGLLATASDSL